MSNVRRGSVHGAPLCAFCDHKWVLAVEMDNGGWLPCRPCPFDGSSAAELLDRREPLAPNVGPWSPDQA